MRRARTSSAGQADADHFWSLRLRGIVMVGSFHPLTPSLLRKCTLESVHIGETLTGFLLAIWRERRPHEKRLGPRPLSLADHPPRESHPSHQTHAHIQHPNTRVPLPPLPAILIIALIFCPSYLGVQSKEGREKATDAQSESLSAVAVGRRRSKPSIKMRRAKRG